MKILTIQQLKNQGYPGSDLKIEQDLGEKDNYQAYIASYFSDGLKIYGYLTVPSGHPSTRLRRAQSSRSGQRKPAFGWPAILFNHGYIPLDKFRTDKQYVRYLDFLAQAGFVVFKPDFRGHGQSEGLPASNFEAGYAVDALNALESLKKLPVVDKQKIGVWGHSMGGDISLKVLLVKPEIKAAVIWAASFIPYNESIKRWFNPQRLVGLSKKERQRREQMVQQVLEQLGDPDKNVSKYQAVSPVSFIKDLKTPLQLHHGLADDRIPAAGSQDFKKSLKKLSKTVELYLYPRGDHNLSGPELKVAMKRSVKFFKKYLK